MTLILVFNFEGRDDRKESFHDVLFPAPEYSVHFYGNEVDESCFLQPQKTWLKQMGLPETESCRVFAHASPLIRNSNHDEFELVEKISNWHKSWTQEPGIILYHGGSPLDILQEAIEEEGLTQKGIQLKLLKQSIEEQKPEFLQKLCELAESDDKETFLNLTPESDSGPEQPYLERLTALDILLQGYLAIFNKEDFFNQGDPQKTKEFIENHEILQGDREAEAKKLIAKDRLFRNKETHGAYGQDKTGHEEPREDTFFWFDECLEEPLPDKPDINGLEKTGEVWDLVTGYYNGGRADIPDEKALTKLFQGAHDEYVFFFESKNKEKRLKALEEKRGTLNHNQIKNSFLLPLSDGDGSSELKNRSRLILSAWDGISNSDPAGSEQVSQASGRSVAEALSTWPSIRQEISDFFEKDIPEAGFSLSEKGKQLYGEIFDENGWVEEIEQFISDFEELAAQNNEKKLSRLDRFFKAIDALHNEISGMRHKEGAKEPFGGCVTDAVL